MRLLEFLLQSLHDSYADLVLCVILVTTVAVRHLAHLLVIIGEFVVVAMRGVRSDMSHAIVAWREVWAEVRVWRNTLNPKNTQNDRSALGDTQTTTVPQERTKDAL